jgi:NitT/TauT family transport system substrate-binding protein
MAIADNVLTDWVKANGMGNIDPDRMAKAIEQTKSVYTVPERPDARCISPMPTCPTDGSLMLQ